MMIQESDQVIPESMELVDEFVDQHRSSQPLEGFTALLIQHQLGNQYTQVKALLDLGLEASDLHWIDIPYTAHPEVRRALIGLGIPEGNLRKHSYRVLEPYAHYQKRRVQGVVWELLRHRPKRLLVLDWYG